MGATSVTGVGIGDSEGKFKPQNNAGCGSKGPRPTPCGPFSCAFAGDFHKQCGCTEPKIQRGCAIKHRVGQKTRIRVGQKTRLKVCG